MTIFKTIADIYTDVKSQTDIDIHNRLSIDIHVKNIR